MPDTQTRLLADQLAYYDTQLRSSLAALFVLSLFMVYLFWEDSGLTPALTWLAVNTFVIALRLYLSARFKRHSATADLARCHRLFLAGVVMTALTWCAGAFLFFVEGVIIKQVILAFFYAGVTSGAITTLSVRKEFAISYLVILLAPLVLLFWMESDPTAHTIVWILGLYGLFLVATSLKYHRMIIDNMLMKYENQNLVDELRASKEKAEEASRTKSEFLSNMSHELRTPMNAILGFVGQLAKKESDPGRQKYFDIVIKSGNTLLNIINDILDLSKIESGKMTIDKTSYPVAALFQESAALFAQQSDEKQITFHRNLSDTLPQQALTDPVRLKQVLYNLLSNAFKFTPENGSVTLDATFDPAKQMLHVAVTDTGIGISEEHQQKVFNAFEQADSSMTRKYGGTGLGLAICSKIITMMGGTLGLESELGKGSRFHFTIPLNATEERKTETKPEVLSADQMEVSERGNILVVEDNKTNQILMSVILDEYDLAYEIANDGLEAVALFKANRYDIVLMDENMPNLNGIEATRKIREFEAEASRPATPIIAVTANAMVEDRERFLSAGMDDYISKPYTEEEVISTLKKHCKRSSCT
jgi:signal transduction histidine kinase/ActR/RegA family two-component response regulator